MDIESKSCRTEPPLDRCFKIKCPVSKYRNLTGRIIDRDIKPVYRNAYSSTNVVDIMMYSPKNPETVTRYFIDPLFNYTFNSTIGFLNDNKLLITSTAVEKDTLLYIHDFLGPYATLIAKIRLNVYYDSIQVFNTFSKTLLIWCSKTEIEKFYEDNNRQSKYYRLKNRKDSWNFRVNPKLLFMPWKLRLDLDISSVLYDRRTLNSKNILHPCKNGYVIITCETIVAVRLTEKVTKIDGRYSNFVEQLCYRISRNEDPEHLYIFGITGPKQKTIVLLPNRERLTLINESKRFPNIKFDAEICDQSKLQEKGLFLVKNSLNLESVINYFLPKSLQNGRGPEVSTLLGCCDYEADFLDEIEEDVLKILIVTVCEIKVVKNQIDGSSKNAVVKNEFHVYSIIAHWNITTGSISAKSIQLVKTVLPHEAANPTKWYPFRCFPEKPKIYDQFEMHVPEEKSVMINPSNLFISENPQNDGKFGISIKNLKRELLREYGYR